MIISQNLQAHAMSFMAAIKEMTPELRDIQVMGYEELCKGEARNLQPLVKPYAEVVFKAMALGGKLGENALENASEEEQQSLLGELTTLMAVVKNGSTHLFPELREDLVNAIHANLALKKELEAPVTEKFGDEAIFLCMMKDGLYAEFTKLTMELALEGM